MQQFKTNSWIKQGLSMALCIGLCSAATAQKRVADTFKTAQGNLIVQPILHATLMLQWNHKTIFVDPYGGAKAFAGLPKPDIIFITDIHPDHLDTASLNSLQLANTTFVVPQSVAQKFPDGTDHKVVIMNNGQTQDLSGISIETIPMYNLPEAPDAMHTKGRGNGYVLNLGGQRVYISGDTEDIPEMRQLNNIDIAFVCMNLPYTMDVDQAASGVLAFQPHIVYPYHYRGQNGLSDIKAFQSKVNEANPRIEVRLRDWYPKY